MSLDSCTNEVISKIVDLYCSEFTEILSEESIQNLTSDYFHVMSKSLVHDVLLRLVKSFPAEKPKNMSSATSVDLEVSVEDHHQH